MQYFDPEINQSYIPYVIETSIGLDRTILMVLSEAYAEEDSEHAGKTRQSGGTEVPATAGPDQTGRLSR